MSVATFPAAGDVLAGRYAIDREIGRGGSSIVYAVRELVSGRDLALKLLVPPPALARTAYQRMEREAAAVRNLDHPGITRVFEFVDEGRWAFLVMEHVAGADLGVVVRERGPMSPQQTTVIGSEVAAALSEAHRRGVLHRDVKPQNVLIADDGHARLTDFGSAWIEGQTTLTQTGAFVGTLDYVAPEVIGGRRGDARSDVYSLGVTLYYALVGRLPDRESAQLPVRPEPGGFRPSRVRGDIPRVLDDAVAKATAAAAGDRFATASEFREALMAKFVERAGAGRSDESRGSRATCCICGGPDRLALDVCPSCASGPPHRSDLFVYAVPLPAKKGWKPVAQSIARLVGTDPGSAGIRDVAAGRKPLLRIGRSDEARLKEHLGSRGIPCRTATRSRRWTAVPGTLWASIATCGAAGTAVGVMVDPVFVWITAAVAVAIGGSALSWTLRPLIVATASIPWLDAATKGRLAEALGQLVPGSARDLLLDVAAACRSLVGVPVGGDAIEVREQTTRLLEACCVSAVEVQRLDLAADRLERHATPNDEAVARCVSARNMLVQRMLEALSALTGSHVELALSPDGAATTLGQRTAELRSELDARLRVARELAGF